MGYTHYWSSNSELDQKIWDRFIEDCNKLYKSMPSTTSIAGGYYKDSPLLLNGCTKYKHATFNKNVVHFNGTAVKERQLATNGYWKDIDDLGHETFRLERTNCNGFCKTARKPYDLMVTACLLLLAYHFGDQVDINSDGYEEEWREAFKFVGHVVSKNIAVLLKLENNIRWAKKFVKV